MDTELRPPLHECQQPSGNNEISGPTTRDSSISDSPAQDTEHTSPKGSVYLEAHEERKRQLLSDKLKSLEHSRNNSFKNGSNTGLDELRAWVRLYDGRINALNDDGILKRRLAERRQWCVDEIQRLKGGLCVPTAGMLRVIRRDVSAWEAMGIRAEIRPEDREDFGEDEDSEVTMSAQQGPIVRSEDSQDERGQETPRMNRGHEWTGGREEEGQFPSNEGQPGSLSESSDGGGGNGEDDDPFVSTPTALPPMTLPTTVRRETRPETTMQNANIQGPSTSVSEQTKPPVRKRDVIGNLAAKLFRRNPVLLGSLPKHVRKLATTAQIKRLLLLAEEVVPVRKHQHQLCNIANHKPSRTTMPAPTDTTKPIGEQQPPASDGNTSSRPTGAGVNTGAGTTRTKTETELEADRLYEERMEEEYAKREGGA
ncbi:hypothetical protein OQA88_10099 [Cercophora sp. LCS_1]